MEDVEPAAVIYSHSNTRASVDDQVWTLDGVEVWALALYTYVKAVSINALITMQLRSIHNAFFYMLFFM